MSATIYFTRSTAIARLIEDRIGALRASLDLAMYRLNHQTLIESIHAASERGIAVRVVLNSDGRRGEHQAIRATLSELRIPFRVSYGRDGPESKMHHKFAILDRAAVVTGSYNWTVESEERNHENLAVLDDLQVVQAYQQEFEKLWSEARESRR